MAHRSMKSSFWTHPRVRALASEEKLVAAYLGTCPDSHISGLYYLNLHGAADLLGMSHRMLMKSMEGLAAADYAHFDPEASEVWVVAMFGHQPGCASPKVLKGVARHLELIHSKSLLHRFGIRYSEFEIPYQYPTEGVSSDESNPGLVPDPVPDAGTDPKEETRARKPKGFTPAEVAISERVLLKLNEHAGLDLRAKNREDKPTAHVEVIAGRLRKGATERELRLVAWHRSAEWKDDEKMAKYLRPSTLFADAHWDEYLDAAAKAYAEQTGATADEARDGEAEAVIEAAASALRSVQ